MTLVEIIIATFIVTVGFLALLGGVYDVGVGRTIVERDAQATAAMTSVMEALHSTSIEDVAQGDIEIPVLLGDSQQVNFFYMDADGVRQPLAAGTGESEDDGSSSSFSVDDLPNPLDLQVQVSWDDDRGRQHSRQFSITLGR